MALPVPQEKKELKKKESNQIIPRELKDIKHQVKGGAYSIGKKEVPDAWKIQTWANDNKINVRVVEHGQGKGYAYAVAEAEDPVTGQVVSDIVYHDFETIRQLNMLDLVDKAIARANAGRKAWKYFVDIKEPLYIDDNGKVVPNLTPEGQIKLMRASVRQENFAIRDAYTKASSRAIAKILNKEWREVEEVELERREVEEVSKQVNKKEYDKRAEKIIKDEIKEENKKEFKGGISDPTKEGTAEENLIDGKTGELLPSDNIEKIVYNIMDEIEEENKPISKGRIFIKLKKLVTEKKININQQQQAEEFTKKLDISGNYS